MYILDTNVLSVIMTPGTAPLVLLWLAQQNIENLFTTTICQAEILAGLSIMPEGKRRFSLEADAKAMFDKNFEDRILPFDSEAAVAYAGIVAQRRQAGLAVNTLDLMIAAIAFIEGATVATRNTGDFAGCGVTLIDPWAA